MRIRDWSSDVCSSDLGSTLWESAGTIETSSLLGAATPAIALDTVVAGYSSGELVAMRIENGRPVWQDTLERTGVATSVAMLSDIDASPAIAEEIRSASCRGSMV